MRILRQHTVAKLWWRERIRHLHNEHPGLCLSLIEDQIFCFNQGLFETGLRLSSADPEMIRASNIPYVFGRQKNSRNFT